MSFLISETTCIYEACLKQAVDFKPSPKFLSKKIKHLFKIFMVCSRERRVTRFCRSNGTDRTYAYLYAVDRFIHTVDRELLNALFFKNSVSRKIRRICRSIFLKFSILRHTRRSSETRVEFENERF